MEGLLPLQLLWMVKLWARWRRQLVWCQRLLPSPPPPAASASCPSSLPSSSSSSPSAPPLPPSSASHLLPASFSSFVPSSPPHPVLPAPAPAPASASATTTATTTAAAVPLCCMLFMHRRGFDAEAWCISTVVGSLVTPALLGISPFLPERDDLLTGHPLPSSTILPPFCLSKCISRETIFPEVFACLPISPLRRDLWVA